MKKIVKIKEKQDKWNQFSYEDKRVFDALSSLLHFESVCCAVTKKQNILLVSYNTQGTGEQSIHSYQKEMVLQIINQDDYQKVLCLYLLLSQGFSGFVKDQIHKEKTSENKVLFNVLSDFRSKLPEFKTNLQKALKEKNSGNSTQDIDISTFFVINELYYNIVKSLKDSQNIIEVKEQLFRPFQDSLKIANWAKNYKNTIQNIQKLDNPEGLHAEYNIAVACEQEKEKPYIGVALLCCVFCDEYLSDMQHNHRGTHGTGDPDWKHSSNANDTLKKQLLEKKVDIPEGEVNFSERRLSIDNFEQEITIDLVGQTLSDYKSDLNLIET